MQRDWAKRERYRAGGTERATSFKVQRDFFWGVFSSPSLVSSRVAACIPYYIYMLPPVALHQELCHFFFLLCPVANKVGRQKINKRQSNFGWFTTNKPHKINPSNQPTGWTDQKILSKEDGIKSPHRPEMVPGSWTSPYYPPVNPLSIPCHTELNKRCVDSTRKGNEPKYEVIFIFLLRSAVWLADSSLS